MKLSVFLKRLTKIPDKPSPKPDVVTNVYQTFYLDEYEFAISGMHFRGFLNSSEAKSTSLIFNEQVVPLLDLQHKLNLSFGNILPYKKIAIIELDNIYFGIFCHKEGNSIKSNDEPPAALLDIQSMMSLVHTVEKQKTLITFSFDKTYAIDVENISEIVPFPESIKTSSNLPAIIKGYFHLKGEPIYIINTKVFCNLNHETDYISKELLIIKNDHFPYAIMIDTFEFYVLFPKDKWIKPQGEIQMENSEKIFIQSQNGDNRILHFLNLDAIIRKIATE